MFIKLLKGKHRLSWKTFFFRENVQHIRHFQIRAMRTKIQWDMGWKLYSIELIICGNVLQKNINIRILRENLKKKWRIGNVRNVFADYTALMNKISVLFDFVKLFLFKIKFYWTKKNLKNNLHFPFLHCFYSSISIFKCGLFLFHYYHYYFYDEKNIFCFLVASYTLRGKMKWICISLL